MLLSLRVCRQVYDLLGCGGWRCDGGAAIGAVVWDGSRGPTGAGGGCWRLVRQQRQHEAGAMTAAS
jgi:hypothetical protein